MKTWALLAVLLAGCIDFDQSKRVYCAAHPGLTDCPRDAGTGGGGSAGGIGGGSSTGGGGDDAGGDGGPPFTIVGDGGPNPVPSMPMPPGPSASPCTQSSVPADQAIYVSADGGNDSNDGGLASPLQHIFAGLAAAKAAGFSEVRVCFGTYAETVTLADDTMSLLGGYDCSTGARVLTCFDPKQPASFAPGSGTLKTVIQPLADGGIARGVRIVSDGGPTLDGFSIMMPVTNDSVGIEVAGGAGSAPQITDNWVNGAVDQCSAPACQTGISVVRGSPLIAWNQVTGGGAQTTLLLPEPVSLGLVVTQTAGSPFIHDNVLAGGLGANFVGYAAVALMLSNAGPLDEPHHNPVESNRITGGQLCNGQSVGVYVTGQSSQGLDLRSNVISGGETLSGDAVGLLAEGPTSGELTIVRNVVVSGLSHDPTSREIAANLDSPYSVLATNDVFYAGGLDGLGRTADVIGVHIGSSMTGPSLSHNAFVAVGSTQDRAMAVEVKGPADPMNVKTSLYNNIFASNGTSQSIGVSMAGCVPNAVVDRSAANLFVGVAHCGAVEGPTCPAQPYLDHPFELDQALGPTIAAGDYEYNGACSYDDGCLYRSDCVGDAGTCMSDVFSGFDAETFGLANLLDGEWFLNPAPGATPPWPACDVVASSVEDSVMNNADRGFDLYGNPRIPPVAIGPFELDTNTCALQ